VTLEESLKEIIKIAERYERDMQACAVAGRIERDRRNAIHAAAAEGSASSGHEDV
jgi:hypothetical protein